MELKIKKMLLSIFSQENRSSIKTNLLLDSRERMFIRVFFPSQESGNQDFHVLFKFFVIIRNNKNMIYLNTNKGFK